MRRLRRLGEKRSFRAVEHAAVAEGRDLVATALATQWPIEALFVEPTESTADLVQSARSRGVTVHECAPGVLARALSAESPQPIAAIVARPDGTLAPLACDGLFVVLDELRDPGNVGTIVRTAAAFGAQGVILTGASVDPFNSKALRASAGAVFHLPVVTAPSVAAVREWSQGRSELLATVVADGEPAPNTWPDDVVLVVGSESHGLGDAALEACDRRVTIAMMPSAESLNVAVATGVLLADVFRDRRRRAAGR